MNVYLQESEIREIQSSSEEDLQAKLKEILLNNSDGKQYQHFADILENFTIWIIPKEEEPDLTASINIEEAKIHISSGFLDEPDDKLMQKQLSVLIRHEMAHSLLEHEFRMKKKLLAKYGQDRQVRQMLSDSFHSLHNIIEDFDISNQWYSEQDKETVLNMKLNGIVIGGLVTEDNRDWQTLSLEDMYEKLSQELSQLDSQILDTWDSGEHKVDDAVEKRGNTYLDPIKYEFNKLKTYYSDVNRPTGFEGSLDSFIAGKSWYHYLPQDKQTPRGTIVAVASFDKLSNSQQNIITGINSGLKETPELTHAQIDEMINKIAKSKTLDFVDVINPISNKKIADVDTPEEKMIAVDALKAMKPLFEIYKTWVDKTHIALRNSAYSMDDLQQILDALIAKGTN